MKNLKITGRAGLAAVTFSARGGRVEKLLSWCVTQGIQLRNVQVDELGFLAVIPARDYARLHRPARRCRTRLRVVKRQGPWFSFRRLLGRPGLLLAPLVFWLVLFYSGQAVWAVRFADIPLTAQSELRQRLAELELCEGGMATPERLAHARRILSEQEEWSWVALNFNRGRLVVEGTPARRKLPVTTTDAGPYYAAADAAILANRVESGFACKKPGQTVTAGEMLIASTREARDGTLVEQDPLGEVIGLVHREYRITRPLETSVTMLTGRTAAARSLFTPFGRWELPFQPKPYEAGEQKLSREPLTLLGLALPATVETVLYAETASLPQRLAPETARQFARYLCLAALYEEFPGAELLAEESEETLGEDALEYTLTATFRANIARKAEEG